jgi:hypothetical protein
MVQVKVKIEIILMLEPNIVKIQHGIRAYVLKNPLHKLQTSRPLSVELYDLLGFPENMYDPLFLGVLALNTWKLGLKIA